MPERLQHMASLTDAEASELAGVRGRGSPSLYGSTRWTSSGAGSARELWILQARPITSGDGPRSLERLPLGQLPVDQHQRGRGHPRRDDPGHLVDGPGVPVRRDGHRVHPPVRGLRPDRRPDLPQRQRDGRPEQGRRGQRAELPLPDRGGVRAAAGLGGDPAGQGVAAAPPWPRSSRSPRTCCRRRGATPAALDEYLAGHPQLCTPSPGRDRRRDQRSRTGPPCGGW